MIENPGRHRQARAGFTLIELAVVIAIIAILAAVAYPKLMQVPESAEEAVAKDYLSQLQSAASMYTAKNSTRPQGFDDFVDTNVPIAADKMISVRTFGTNADTNPCTVAPATISCNGTFRYYPNVTYQWNDGAIVITGVP